MGEAATSLQELLEQALATVKARRHDTDAALKKVLAERAELDLERAQLRTERSQFEEELWCERVELQREREALRRDRQAVEQVRRELERERLASARLAAGPNDLVGLNFGGERTLTVKRSLLTQFEGSMLARMFSGVHDHCLDRDHDGNVFFDYSPAVMVPLIEFLRLYRDAPPERRAKLELPQLPDGLKEAWQGMLEFVGLAEVLLPSKPPAVVFSGVRTEVPLDQLEGWTLFFSRPYSHTTTLADFEPPPELCGGALLVGARHVGSKVLAVAAMGNYEVVTQVRSEATTTLHNGVHWYCARDRAVGFAPDERVNLNPADSAWRLDPLRLSWHLTRDGGWRAGSAVNLNQSLEFEKVIFASSVRLAD